MALLDLEAETVGRVAEELGSRVLPIACDVTQDSPVEAAVGAFAERLGAIRALHNNAGLLLHFKGRWR